MKKVVLMALIFVAMVAFSRGAEMREWSSSDGSSTMTASVVKILIGKVVLKKDGGAACQALLEKYRGVPVIEETLKALCKKID